MTDDDRRIRLFAGVQVEGAPRDQLSRALPKPIPGRPVPEENWHLTLHFIGPTPVLALESLSEHLDEIAEGYPPFDVVLAGMGAFPSLTRARVLWVGVDEDADRLKELAGATGGRLARAGYGTARELGGFQPHLSVARMRPPESVSGYVRRAPAFEVVLPAREIGLFESRSVPGGVRYRVLHRAALANRAD